MKELVEGFLMILALLGLFFLGYICGLVDTLHTRDYFDIPCTIEKKVETYKEGNVIINYYHDHKEYNKATIPDKLSFYYDKNYYTVDYRLC